MPDNNSQTTSEKKLQNCRVAILATNGFEQDELLKPLEALKQAGAETVIVSLEQGRIKGWTGGNWGQTIEVQQTVDVANPDDFDALVLPGGVINPDKLRMNEKAVAFTKSFTESGKPIAAICHGPQTLIETGFVKGKKMTSWPSLKTDLINAGAQWVDQEVVTDKGFVTSRKPDDIPAFNKKMIEEIAEGQHNRSVGQKKNPDLQKRSAESSAKQIQ